MTKIPFDIKYRPQIESGEYKVILENEHSGRVLAWDLPGDFPIAIADVDDTCAWVGTFDNKGWCGIGKRHNCLFVVTPEPELSEFENSIFKLLRQYKECDIPLTPENIKAEASMLWQDFEKYFFILYGKEGEGDSALRNFYYRGLADGKAETLKDLPRWKKDESFEPEGTFIGVKGREWFVVKDGYSVSVAELIEKLPRFKED